MSEEGESIFFTFLKIPLAFKPAPRGCVHVKATMTKASVFLPTSLCPFPYPQPDLYFWPITEEKVFHITSLALLSDQSHQSLPFVAIWTKQSDMFLQFYGMWRSTDPPLKPLNCSAPPRIWFSCFMYSSLLKIQWWFGLQIARNGKVILIRWKLICMPYGKMCYSLCDHIHSAWQYDELYSQVVFTLL